MAGQRNFIKHFGQNFLVDSQKQGIIKLIEKQNKDKRYVTNWRPISLLNVNVKIASKAITLRLEKVLSDLISDEQCAYVKGTGTQILMPYGL